MKRAGTGALVALLSAGLVAAPAAWSEDVPRVGIRDTELRHLDSKIVGERRARDLTPVHRARFDDSGGAGRFVRFMREELFPFVDARYRTRPGDRTVYGHSFGGLFAHYALLEQPGLFQRFVSISPSVWYADRYLIRKEKEIAASGRRLDAVLYTAVGEKESDYFVSDWKELTARLASRSDAGLLMRSEVLANENHRSIFGVAFTNGLRYVFSENPPPPE